MKEAEIKRIIYHYGKEAQKDVAVEEMAELTKELMKERRGANNKDAILEEIADVSVMLQQLLMIYNFTEEDVNRIAEEKIERQLKRIGNIEQEPTVDAVPVIRCKDCKYWHCDDVDTYCYKLSIFDTDMNSYCSYAERKEE